MRQSRQPGLFRRTTWEVCFSQALLRLDWSPDYFSAVAKERDSSIPLYLTLLVLAKVGNLGIATIAVEDHEKTLYNNGVQYYDGNLSYGKCLKRRLSLLFATNTLRCLYRPESRVTRQEKTRQRQH